MSESPHPSPLPVPTLLTSPRLLAVSVLYNSVKSSLGILVLVTNDVSSMLGPKFRPNTLKKIPNKNPDREGAGWYLPKTF